MCLDEVKRILIETCKTASPYTEQIKEVVYIGIKVIHKAIHEMDDNLKEVLTMNGTDIMKEIFDLLIKEKFKVNEDGSNDI